MRFQVRKRGSRWEVGEFNGRCWVLLYEFPTFWQAMYEVTGQLPYDRSTPWTAGIRPVCA